jgi:hypothetical protein
MSLDENRDLSDFIRSDHLTNSPEHLEELWNLNQTGCPALETAKTGNEGEVEEASLPGIGPASGKFDTDPVSYLDESLSVWCLCYKTFYGPKLQLLIIS